MLGSTNSRDFTVTSLAGAACVGADPDLFFSDDADDIAAAKGVCSGCPVTVACHTLSQQPIEFIDSVIPRAEFGVWAGEVIEPPRFRGAAVGGTPRQRMQGKRREEARSLRDDAGMNPNQIALLWGVNRSTVANLLKGDTHGYRNTG